MPGRLCGTVAVKPLHADSLTRGVGVHRSRDDQCLSTRIGGKRGMAAKSTRRGTIQTFLVPLCYIVNISLTSKIMRLSTALFFLWTSRNGYRPRPQVDCNSR